MRTLLVPALLGAALLCGARPARAQTVVVGNPPPVLQAPSPVLPASLGSVELTSSATAPVQVPVLVFNPDATNSWSIGANFGATGAQVTAGSPPVASSGISAYLGVSGQAVAPGTSQQCVLSVGPPQGVGQAPIPGTYTVTLSLYFYGGSAVQSAPATTSLSVHVSDGAGNDSLLQTGPVKPNYQLQLSMVLNGSITLAGANAQSVQESGVVLAPTPGGCMTGSGILFVTFMNRSPVSSGESLLFTAGCALIPVAPGQSTGMLLDAASLSENGILVSGGFFGPGQYTVLISSCPSGAGAATAQSSQASQTYNTTTVR